MFMILRNTFYQVFSAAGGNSSVASVWMQASRFGFYGREAEGCIAA